MNYITVTPAYGRDYPNATKARADWFLGQDFILQDVSSKWDGKPCSIRDFNQSETEPSTPTPPTTVNIRYKSMTQVTVVKPDDGVRWICVSCGACACDGCWTDQPRTRGRCRHCHHNERKLDKCKRHQSNIVSVCQ